MLLKLFLIKNMLTEPKKQQPSALIPHLKKFNIAKSIPTILFLSLTSVLFLFNWLGVASNGYDLYDRPIALGFFAIANIVLLAVSARSNTSAVEAQNDRQSSKPDGGDRFFSLSTDMLCIIGFDGYFKHVNPAAEKILGYSPASMLGQPFIEFVHPDDREATLKEAESIAAGNSTVWLENRWRCKDSSYKWLAWNATPFDEEESIYAVGREITDRKLAEESLQQSNSILRSVIESTPDVIFVKDIHGRYAIANSVAADWLSTSVEAMIGRDDTNFFPPEIAQQIIEADRRIVTAGEYLNYEEIVPKNGEKRTLLTTKCPWKDAEGNIIGVVGVSRDISDRKEIEAALLESNILFENVIESTGDSIFVKDTTSRYLLVNSTAARIIGLPKSEIIGKKDAELFESEIAQMLVENDRRIWQSGIEETIEEAVKDSEGNILTVLATKSPLRDRAGNITGVVGVARDISDRKQAEKALQESQRFIEQIANATPNILYLYDEIEQRNVYSNREITDTLGYTVEEVQALGSNLLPATIHPDDLAKFPEYLQQLENAPDGDVIEYEYRVRAKDNSWRWLISREIVFSRTESGKLKQRLGAATDVTERKIAEQALAEQLKLSLFTADVGIALTQNCTLPTTLQKCCDAVVRHLDAAFARIWTLNEAENVLELQASGGMYTHIDGAHSRIAVGEFKIGLIAKERKPHITNSVKEDPRISDKEWAARAGMVAFAGYPLIVDDQLLGVIAMFARLELNESTLVALASSADSIALGIKRKQTEEALATQQQTLRSIIDNAPIWVWMIEASGRMLLVNKTFCEDVAIPESRFLAASHYSEVLGVEASANCMASDVQAWSQDTPCYAEEILQLADGKEHFFETIKTQVKDASGNSMGLVGLGLDVTQERESKRNLQDSEARFRNLAEQEALLNHLANNIRASLDLDTILATTVNQIRELLQLDRCLFIWYQPEAERPVWNITYEAKNPEQRSMLGLYPTDATGSHAARIANLEIIRIDDFDTVTNAVERDFFISIGFNSLLDIPIQTQSGQIGAIACATCGSARLWSDGEVELLIAVGTQLAIAINQAELYTQSVDSARIAQEQAAQLEVTLCELKLAQTQLVQAEKMSSLGQMVAGIAHEINNPVSFIFGNLTYTEEYTRNLMKLLQMYRDEYPEPTAALQEEVEALELDFLLDDLPKMLSSMQVGATRIRDIVRSLRNFSRLDESDMKNVNIHEGIDSTLMILEHRLKAQPDCPAIQVIKEYGQLPLVECYAGLLNQVFMNIIANAIDALQEPLENPGIIGIRTKVEDNFATIVIADNGAGITDKVKQRIFDPFYTTKPIGSGTGMGLAISHSIVVEKHKGEIKCLSVVGKGTKFILKVPIQRREN